MGGLGNPAPVPTADRVWNAASLQRRFVVAAGAAMVRQDRGRGMPRSDGPVSLGR